MLGYKISLEDLRRLKSYQAFFFQPKLYETRNQFQLILKKTGKLQTMWRLKTRTWTISSLKMKSKEKKKILRQLKKEAQETKAYEMQQK